MNNYAQFFDKYTEAKNTNKVSYGKNTIKAVNQYLKNNGYQVTKNDVLSGCKVIAHDLGKHYDSHSGNYGVSPTDTTIINNSLAKVFPPKQNTTQPQPQEQTAQIQGQAQPQSQPPQNPEGDGSKNPGDNPPKEDLPQADPMNDLAGISMLTKDELRAMVNNGSLPKIMKSLMNAKTINKSHPGIKISNIQIIGTDNLYDNEDNTNNKSRKLNNKQQNKSNKVKQGNQNGQVKA